MSDETQAPVVAPPKGASITFEEFLQWGDDHTHAEWVDGEILAMSPASFEHQDLVGFLAATMRHFAESHDLGKVLTAPFPMRLAAVGTAREPDIMFVASAQLGRIQSTHLDGPANLVVEFVSASSRTRDRRDKLGEYEAAGVGEYWVVDPGRQSAEYYVRADDGCLELVMAGSAGRFDCRELRGLWVETAWFWRNPLPKMLDVVRQWGLLS